MSEGNNQVKEITMIFDDLKNIAFTKEFTQISIRPSIISMSIVRIALN